MTAVPYDTRKIIILAGSRQQFEKYLDDNGLTNTQAIYGFDESAIAGIQAQRVVIVGTFWERNDGKKLLKLAKERVI